MLVAWGGRRIPRDPPPDSRRTVAGRVRRGGAETVAERDEDNTDAIGAGEVGGAVAQGGVAILGGQPGGLLHVGTPRWHSSNQLRESTVPPDKQLMKELYSGIISLLKINVKH